MSFTKTLTQKIGPLPVWTWGAAIGAAVLGVSYWQSLNAASTAATAPVILPANSTAMDYAYHAVDSSGGQNVLAQTNATWFASAIASLSGKGYARLDIMDALTNFLNGTPLSDSQKAIVNDALMAQGSPPDGAPSTTSAGDYVRFIRDAAGDYYGVYSNGAMNKLSTIAYLALGSPVLSSDAYKPTTATPTPTPVKLPTKWTPTKDTPHYGGFVVDAGDTLSAISYASGTSVQKLMSLNGITDPNAVLTPGVLIKTE